MHTNPESDTDTRLMLGVKAGDVSCFEQLVERNKQRVLDLAYRFLGARADCHDVAQEVFINIYKARERYEPSARFTTWLYTICRNTCYKSVRKRNPFLMLKERDSVERAVTLQQADPNTLSPVDHLLLDERVDMIRRALDALPDTQRMALILRRYDGLSYEEIARVMGLSLKAVKALLHRAKTALALRMDPYLRSGVVTKPFPGDGIQEHESHGSAL